MKAPETGAYRLLFMRAIDYVLVNEESSPTAERIFTDEEIAHLQHYKRLLENPNWKMIDVTTIRFHQGVGSTPDHLFFRS